MGGFWTLGGRQCGGGLLHGGLCEFCLGDVASPAREETARGGEPRSCRAHPGEAIRVVGPPRDAGGGPGGADQQHARGGVIREVVSQHRLVEGIAGPFGPGMGVHVDQPGHQPAAVHHCVGAHHAILAEHPAIDAQGALFPFRQHGSAHMQHHVPCLSGLPGRGPEPRDRASRGWASLRLGLATAAPLWPRLDAGAGGPSAFWIQTSIC